MTEKVEAVIHIGDVGLLHRELHLQLHFQQMSRLVPEALGLLARSSDEDDEVIGVADQPVRRVTPSAVVGRASGVAGLIFPVPLEAFIQYREVDVRQ